jgi:hypothetical protein
VSPLCSSKKLPLQHSAPQEFRVHWTLFAARSASSATFICERPLNGSAGRAATGEGLCKQEFLSTWVFTRGDRDIRILRLFRESCRLL